MKKEIKKNTNIVAFRDDYVDGIRDRLNIPENYTSISVDEIDFHELSERHKELKVTYFRNMDLKYGDSSSASKITDYDIVAESDFCITIHGKYFKLVSVEASLPLGRYVDYKLLFIKETDVKKFFNKYIKNTELSNFKPYSYGIYEIKQTQQGQNYLNALDVSKEEMPILNDDLNKQLINEINSFCKKKDIYKKHDLQYKRGIMLYGAPGNGKTSFIKSFTKDLDAITVVTNIRENDEINFIKKFISNDAYRDKLKIVVIEDIDGMHDSDRSDILNLLDGLTITHKTVFIATTNYPHKLDSALTNRPSRFDSIHHLDNPNDEVRKQLFLRFFPKMKKDVLDSCIEESDGLSGAYFKEIFLYGQINDLDPIESIKKIKSRLETAEKYSETMCN